MKKCLDCSTQMPDDVFVCPNCGSSSTIGGYSGTEAIAALEAMSKANRAERIVDEAAQIFFAGDQPGAIAKLHEALAVNPRSAMANFNMGYILLQQGKASEAVPWLEKALGINPGIEGGPAALARARAEAQKSKGCFIATAVYGSAEAAPVLVLRHFRDHLLLPSAIGRMLVRLYYTFSPGVAAWLATHPRARHFVRFQLLDRLVRWLSSTLR